MSLKDLFFNSETTNDEPKQENVVKETTKTKFPTEQSESTSIFPNFGFGKPNPPVDNGQISQEHLTKALEVYKNGFESLNQQGYDFYEFYQTVMQGGPDNPQTYGMAMTMGKVMDKSITKEKLIQQSDFYITEINKQYNDYISKGNFKKEELIQQKNNENQSLMGELDLMKQQMEALKTQIQDRENKLSAIDGKYSPKISDINSKLSANDLAKNTLIQSIEKVKNNIQNNIN